MDARSYRIVHCQFVLVWAIIFLIPIVLGDSDKEYDLEGSKCNGTVRVNGTCVGAGVGKGSKNDKKKDGDNKLNGTWQDKYGLVPLFLIGASAVIVIYIIFHCLYLHCYAKKKMRKMADDNAEASRNYMANNPSPNLQPVTPIVKYDGGYGKTEFVHTKPYLLRQEDIENEYMVEEEPHGKVTKLQNVGKKKGKVRKQTASPCPQETMDVAETEQTKADQKGTRTSICFIPVGQTVADPNNGSSQWTPLQGYMCSNVVYTPSKLKGGSPGISITSNGDNSNGPVFIFPHSPDGEPMNTNSLILNGGKVQGTMISSPPGAGSTEADSGIQQTLDGDIAKGNNTVLFEVHVHDSGNHDGNAT